MTTAIARSLMALAGCCLGNSRREWAIAMEAEFVAAVEDRNELDFALGCLVGACREMPAHAEGRFVLASYALAIFLILPMASLLILGALLGVPYLYPWHVDLPALLAGSGTSEFLITDGNRTAIPALAMTVLLLGLGHLRIAWQMLEHDWEGVAASARLTAAATVTLVAFTALLFLDDAKALMQAGVLAVELGTIAVLARWHAQLAPGASSSVPAS